MGLVYFQSQAVLINSMLEVDNVHLIYKRTSLVLAYSAKKGYCLAGKATGYLSYSDFCDRASNMPDILLRGIQILRIVNEIPTSAAQTPTTHQYLRCKT
jgi:hypothetical protein